MVKHSFVYHKVLEDIQMNAYFFNSLRSIITSNLCGITQNIDY